MLKLLIIAAILACANGYYNHGPVHQPYYGNYGHAVSPSPIAPAAVIPVNPHHGNLYNPGYGNYGDSHPKIIEATYPGAVHKSASYSATNSDGYIGTNYGHGAVNHVSQSTNYVNPNSGILGHSAISGHSALPYSHVAPAVSYNHDASATYAHQSRYAVTEGPNYVNSRYAISGSPGLSYGHESYSVPSAHGVQKIAYNPHVSHMGYQSHAAQSYGW